MNRNDIPVRLGFVLLPQFAMGALAVFTDLLGLLATVRAPGCCAWEIAAETLIPIRSASGVQVVPTDLLGDPGRFEYVVVVGGPLAPPAGYSPDLLGWLRAAARGGGHLLGLGDAVFALAQAGVLAGHRVCVAGSQYREFTQRFPSIDPAQIVVDRPVVYDRRRITCAGGPALTELAVRLLHRHVPEADLQRALYGLQMSPGDFADSAHQTQPALPGLPEGCPPALRRAVLLLEQYCGNPLSMHELANRLGLSARQIQRLFREHLDTTPQAYARRLRLHLVAWTLEHTDKSIATIASDCGYADAAHLNRDFRSARGMPPGAWRKAHAGGLEA